MNYTIIVGSHREDSESSKVSKYIEKYLLNKNAQVNIIDLKSNPIPLYDESLDDENSDLSKFWKKYSDILESSDGFIVISPEWNGMATPGLKNFFLYIDQEMAHKPALLVSISSGTGGAYPIAELRMSSYKNTFVAYLPIHVIVRNVESVFNEYEFDDNDEEDKRIKLRMNNSLDILEGYTEALVNLRQNKSIDLMKHNRGM